MPTIAQKGNDLDKYESIQVLRENFSPVLLPILIILVATLVALTLSRSSTFKTIGRPKLNPSTGFILCFLITAGFLLLLANGKNVQEGFIRKRWPQGKGLVLLSEVRGGRVYQPLVTYSYNVNGSDFTGQTDLRVPYFGVSSARKEVAYKTIADYSQGNTVKVYYNPENPAESYLKPGPRWSEFTRLSLGIFLYGFGIFGLGTYWSCKKSG